MKLKRKDLKILLFLLFVCISTQGCSKDTNISQRTSATNKTIEGFYSQEYSSEHLKTHPKQTVQHISALVEYLSSQKKQEWNMNSDAQVEFLIKFKNLPHLYVVNGWCSSKTEFSLECYVDGDGGNFSLTSHDNKLDIKFKHLRVYRCDKDEEDINNGKVKNGISGLESQKGGDDYFLLYKISKEEYQKISVRSGCL